MKRILVIIIVATMATFVGLGTTVSPVKANNSSSIAVPALFMPMQVSVGADIGVHPHHRHYRRHHHRAVVIEPIYIGHGDDDGHHGHHKHHDEHHDEHHDDHHDHH